MARWSRIAGASMAGWTGPGPEGARAGEDSAMQVTTRDTGEAIVPLTPYGAEPPRPPRTPGRWILPFGAVGLVVAALLWFVHLPYIAIAPGSAIDVSELIAAPPDRAFPPKGDIYLLTVSLHGLSTGSGPTGLAPLEALRFWVDPDSTVVDKRLILGDSSDRQILQENRELMSDSQTTAKYLAFRRLGYDIVEQGDGARVVGVAPDAPAAGKLRDGDVITAVNGQPIATANQIIEAIIARSPGDSVTLTVTREAASPARSVTVTLGSRSSDGANCFAGTQGPAGACMGVAPATKNRRFNFPYDVNIEAGRIGGPSAGLAFTLGLLDYLTAGELTGGGKVAVTGEITADGQVKAIGGVPQKVAAAIDEGAEYFLVPAGELQQAQAKAGRRIKVIGVATLEEAIQALGRIGGDISALGPPPPTAQG